MDIDDAFFDLSPYIKFDREALSEEFSAQLDLPHTFLSTHKEYDTMQGMHPFVPGRTLVNKVTEMIPIPGENQIIAHVEPDGQHLWSWQYIQGATEMPIHKDPNSYCWVAFNIRGEQEIGFYEDDKETPIGFKKYTVALVNSKVYHAPRSDGGERLLLRRMFTINLFYQMKKYFKTVLTLI